MKGKHDRCAYGKKYRQRPEVQKARKVYAKTYAKTKNGKAARLRADRKRLIKNASFINTIKLKSGCIKCGYKRHPSALDFAHRDRSSKLFSIGGKKSRVTIEQLIDEISKCDILCANCHRIKSFNEYRQKG